MTPIEKLLNDARAILDQLQAELQRQGTPTLDRQDAKDWFVTQFKDSNGSLFSFNHPRYLWNAVSYTYEECVNMGYSINCVQRFSDNTYWRVGDKTTNGDITGFVIIGGSMRIMVDNGFSYPLSMITEAAKKEWEIIEFKPAKPMYHHSLFLRPNGKYAWGKNIYDNTLDEMLTGEDSVADGSFTIHSVRRLSDGEVFSVGDLVTNGTGGSAPISGIILSGQAILVSASCFFSQRTLAELVKAPVTFPTADGATVKEGDTVYFLSYGVVTPCTAILGLNWNNHYSTHEAAERAWIRKQPVLSM